MRAKNNCGSGAYSDEVDIRTASLPSPINSVVITQPAGSCVVHIAWEDPSIA